MTDEAQIRADVEVLRAQISDTQSLYREVCAILFFRYGVTPTTNKLYQYVRKGSMSAPAEALARFWADLREKSRVRIEHPDLPETLKSAAGELVASLWTQAQEAAQKELAAFRAEVLATAQESEAARKLAESERTAVIYERGQLLQAIQAAKENSLQLERELAAERASKEALIAQLQAAGRQQAAREAALIEARSDFAAELEKQRQALLRAEERYEASEKRALLEIDRERTAAAKLQRELAQIRQHQQTTEDRHRTEMALLQNTLSEARQQLGASDGTLQEMRITNQRLAEQVQSLVVLAERETQRALMEHQAEAGQGTVSAAVKHLHRRTPAALGYTGTRLRKKRKNAEVF